MSDRDVLLVGHVGRAEAVAAAQQVAARLTDAGLRIRAAEPLAAALELPGDAVAVPVASEGVDSTGAAIAPEAEALVRECEIAVVLGGDGTLLRAAELTHACRVPLLGVNLGHVGFLAEAEREQLSDLVERVVARDYDVEERMTVDVTVRVAGREVARTWALNEASIEKSARDRMLDVVAEVDGRPLSRWGCDGVICATPTGSTAYAFSAGGPIVWPEVEALLMIPLSAHALFSRPIVVAPSSTLAVELQSDAPHGVLWVDGRRTWPLPAGARVEVRRGQLPVRLARLHQAPFTDRLVRKFELPVEGWRGAAAYRRARALPGLAGRDIPDGRD